MLLSTNTESQCSDIPEIYRAYLIFFRYIVEHLQLFLNRFDFFRKLISTLAKPFFE